MFFLAASAFFSSSFIFLALALDWASLAGEILVPRGMVTAVLLLGVERCLWDVAFASVCCLGSNNELKSDALAFGFDFCEWPHALLLDIDHQAL